LYWFKSGTLLSIVLECEKGKTTNRLSFGKKKTVFWIFLSGSDLADHEIVSGSILAITHTDITHETVQVILKNIKDMLYCLSKFSNFL
jgi:hypothetical protein